MPQYKNNNAADVAVGQYRIPPGETVTIYDYLENLPSGVVKVSDLPLFDQIKLSQVITADATISVPASLTDYLITVSVISGDAEIRFNSDSMTPAEILLEGMSDSWKCKARTINDVRVHFTSSGGKKAIVTIKKA